jgi:hypothetical protein
MMKPTTKQVSFLDDDAPLDRASPTDGAASAARRLSTSMAGDATATTASNHWRRCGGGG